MAFRHRFNARLDLISLEPVLDLVWIKIGLDYIKVDWIQVGLHQIINRLTLDLDLR